MVADSALVPLATSRAARGSLGDPRASWRQAVVRSCGIWLGLRIALTLIALISRGERAIPPRPAVPQSFFTLFYHWDSSYYLEIAHGGYFDPTDHANIQAFLPGYPLVSRITTMLLFPLRPVSVGELTVGLFAVSAAASLVAAIGLWKLTAEHFGQRAASAAVLLLLGGPYAVFLTASYSESLFLAFAVFAWYFALRGRWVAAGLLGAGASMTRIDGLFLAAALGVLFVSANGREWRSNIGRAVRLVGLSVSGLAAYFGYLWVRTGNPAAWFTAEHDGWNRGFRMPWTAGAATLAAAFDPGGAFAYRAQSLLEFVFALVGVAAVVALVRLRWWGSTVLVGMTLASLMTSTTYLSLARETLLLFPVGIVIASCRDAPGRRWIFRAALVLGFALFVFNAREFTLGHWAE